MTWKKTGIVIVPLGGGRTVALEDRRSLRRRAEGHRGECERCREHQGAKLHGVTFLVRHDTRSGVDPSDCRYATVSGGAGAGKEPVRKGQQPSGCGANGQDWPPPPPWSPSPPSCGSRRPS